MTIKLQVSDVRDSIFRAAGQSEASPDGPTVRIFNEAVAELLGPHRSLNLHAAIEEIEPSFENWQRALIGHTYHRLIGPRLQQQQASLHHLSEQVLTLWDAAQELCSWLAGQLIEARENGEDDLTGYTWHRIEEPVSIEIDPVEGDHDNRQAIISGPIDYVWQSPVSHEWIIIGLRTNQTSTETGRLEACLTHLLLQAKGECFDSNLHAAPGVKRLSFVPTRVEVSYQTDELVNLRPELFELIAQTGQRVPTGIEPTISPDSEIDSGPLGDRLLAALREFGLTGRIDQSPLAAPSYLRFSVSTVERLRGNSNGRLAREIQAQLELDAPPQIGTDGDQLLIDLPRPDRQRVSFDDMRDQIRPGDGRTGSAALPLGIDLDGHLRMIDFSQPENAHLLIAGAVGSGKSSWMRAAVAGLMLTNSPATLRLLLIDPSGRTFAGLSQSPYLFSPLIEGDGAMAVGALSALGDEMERRYRLLANHGVHSLEELTGLTPEPLPRIFCLCDEYADLLLDRKPRRIASGGRLEAEITRLGQRARIAGIHLIFSTSQPGREIVRGVIDANFPARIGLRMNKAIESKLVLNRPGAEMLLGDGDLLFRNIGELIRLQGLWLADRAV